MADPVSNAPIEQARTTDERQWALLAHLGGIIATYLSASALGFVAPLVIWQLKKGQSRYIEDQAKEALNFQITILVAAAVLCVVGGLFGIVTLGLGFLLVAPAGVALAIYALVLAITAAIKANAGETYRYPLTLRLVK